MILRKVMIENFRAFSRIEVELEETTVLVGENNSGKSAFLEAVKFGLGKSLSRKVNPFEEYDYHLRDNNCKPGDSGDIKLTFQFNESAENEWSADLLQALADVVVLDGVLKKITLQIKSSKDPVTMEMVTDWDFLDSAGQPLAGRAKQPQALSNLQKIRPLFFLSALRDAGKEFTSRSNFWAPFLKNHSISAELKSQLEASLGELNDKIITANTQLTSVKDRLAKTKDVLSVATQDTVSIEALPLRLWDMLSRAQVNIASSSGVALPLMRHGAGTQSLSVVLLFEAFIESALKQSYDELSEPILALEEPEAHLHPNATRVLWSLLSGLRGQKIISTHSGDLLSEVPLRTIRRFYKKNGSIETKQINLANLNADEQRKIAYHIQSTRGELFFARSWLFVEGETEYWIVSGVARILGIRLEQIGIRVIPFANIGIVPLLKVANDLGVEWHCVVDNDPAGAGYIRSIQPYLNGKIQNERATILPFGDMELMLCNLGFGTIYENHIAPQKANLITVPQGHADYWSQVLKAQEGNYKTKAAIEVVEDMERKGTASVPPVIKDAINQTKALASIL